MAYAESDLCFIDAETRALPGLEDPRWGDITKTSTQRYARSSRVILLPYAIGGGDVAVWELTDFGRALNWRDAPADLARFLRAVRGGEAKMVAYNSAFDRAVLNHGMIRETRKLTFGVPDFLDAMAQADASALPPGLDGAAKAIGQEGKLYTGKELIQMFSPADGLTPRDRPERWEEFVEYSAIDVEMLREVWRATRPLSIAEWREFWASEAVNDRGLPVDRAFAEGAADFAAVYKDTLNDEVARISDGDLYSPNQHAAIAAWVYDRVAHDSEMAEILVKQWTEDEDQQRLEPGKFSLDRQRCERLVAYLTRLDTERGLTDDEFAAYEIANLKTYGASATPLKFAKALPALTDQDRLPNQYVFNGAPQTGRFSARGVQCVVGEHEVLTPQGWRRIDEAPAHCVMMAWDAASGRMSWQDAEIASFGDAEVVGIDSAVIRGFFTLDHRMPALTRGNDASVVDKTPAGVLRSGRADNLVVAAPVGQAGLPLTNTQLRVCVAMQADGTWAKRAAVWHFAKERKLARLTQLLERAGVSFKVSAWGDDTRGVRVNTHDVPGWLAKDFGPWVLGLSAAQAGVVLEECALWDGWSHVKNGALCVSSPRLDQMQWLQTIAALAGRTATLAGYADAKGYQHFRLYLRASERTSVYRKHVTDTETRPVFCPTVPGGYWLCRFRDRVFLTGNTHNLTRKSLGADEAPAIEFLADRAGGVEDFRARFGDPGRGLSLLVRPMFAAPEGRTLVWADLSSIEARVLPWLSASSGGEQVLDIFRANDADPNAPDHYCLEAAKIKGTTAQDVWDRYRDGDPTGKEDRQTGKIAVLSLGFGGALGALLKMAAAYGMGLSEAEAKTIVSNWRAGNPWAQEFWGALWNAFQAALTDPGEVYEAGRIAYLYNPDYLGGAVFGSLPDGRLLTYRMPRLRQVEVEDPKTGRKTKENKMMFLRGREWRFLWHGLLAENATQGAAASILRDSLRAAEEDEAFPAAAIGHTHDEIIAETLETAAEEAAEQLREIMTAPRDWAAGLPLRAETTTNWYYTKALGD